MYFNSATIFAAITCLAGIKTAAAAPVEGFTNATSHIIKREEEVKAQLWQESYGPHPDDVQQKGSESGWFATTLKRFVELDYEGVQRIFTDGKIKFTPEELKNVNLTLTTGSDKNVPVTVDLSDPSKIIKDADSNDHTGNLWVAAIEGAALKLDFYDGLKQNGDHNIQTGDPADAMRMLTGKEYRTAETDGSHDNQKWIDKFNVTPIFCKTFNRAMEASNLNGDTWYAIVGYEKKGDGFTDQTMMPGPLGSSSSSSALAKGVSTQKSRYRQESRCLWTWLTVLIPAVSSLCFYFRSDYTLMNTELKEPIIVSVQESINDFEFFAGPE
ncbi:hypothetical protein IAT40_003673 [Kwoniella sp. CBS 6097]